MSQETFEIIEGKTREYRQFNTRGTQRKVRLNPSPISDKTMPPDTIGHFIDGVNELFNHLLENVGDGDMFVVTIHNEVLQDDKNISFSFSRIRFR